jgi:hypothetical protein
VDLKRWNIYGNTPLWTALFGRQDNLGIDKMCLDKGAKVDNVNEAGLIPRQLIRPA